MRHGIFDGGERLESQAERYSHRDFYDVILDTRDEHQTPCTVCRGSGRDPLSDNVNWLPCLTCGGAG